MGDHEGLKTPGIRELTSLPPSAAGRRVAAGFHWMAARPSHAFACMAALAWLCGVLEQVLWIPAPLRLPFLTLMPGVLLSALALFPRRLFASLILGAWLGDLAGWLLPSLLGPGATADTALMIATANTIGGIVAGLLLRLAFERLQPQLEMRLVIALPPCLIGALVAGVLLWLVGTPADHPPWPAALGLRVLMQVLGQPLVTLPVMIWWLHSHGCALKMRICARELALLTLALASATAFGLQHQFPLQGMIGVFLALTILAAIAMRFPLRVVSLVIPAYFVVAGAYCIDAFRNAGPATAADTEDVLAMQITTLLPLFGLILLSIAHNSRRLAEQQLRRYARQLAAGEEDRRGESASAVREGIAQSLIGVRFALNALDRRSLPDEVIRALDEALQTVSDAQDHAEDAMRDLGPQGLEDLGLAPVIDSLLGHLRRDSDARLTFEHSGPLQALPLPVRRLAFRVVSELARNAIRHARPKHIAIVVCAGDAVLQIAVSDDGRGFAPASILSQQHSGSGLFGLRERIALEGGVFSIRSGADAGCVIDVRLPLGA